MGKNISIAYTLFEHEKYMAIVSMQSILQNNKNNNVKFYILLNNV